MKRKTLWILLTCLVTVAVLLVSCKQQTASPTTGTTVTGTTSTAPTTVTPTQTTTATATTELVKDSLGRMVEKPQYGGTFPMVVGQTGGFDPANSMNFWPSWVLIYDALVAQDWTKGPSGTGENAMVSGSTPGEFLTGWLAERWEIHSLKSITYYLRKGIKFQNKAPVNGRELTADDVVYNFERAVKSSQITWYNSKVTITKIDKYTVRFDNPDTMLEPQMLAFSNLVIGAPEIAQQFGDMADWKKVVGTGPFMVTDVVPDSSVTYVRNPNYWAYDPLFPENRLPYLDGIRALVVLDPSTQDAALRTGKIDRLTVTKQRADMLLKSATFLKERTFASATTQVLSVRLDLKTAPYANVKVRQALMLAIDNAAIAKDYYLNDATIMQWPYSEAAGSIYTPLEKLPANLKELFEYHPDKAKALLTEAGYPNGFDMKIQVLANYAGGAELYSIVKSYWDAIGVNTTIEVLETGAYWSAVVGKTYKDAVPTAWGTGTMESAMAAHNPTYLYNYSKVDDTHINEVWLAARETVDLAARNKMMKELGLYIIEQQYWLNMPTPKQHILWQPWLKGYNGEVSFGTVNGWYGMYRFTWVDQKLRTSLGHK
jgi:peptide/nickel transport system substrate-binding protein